jgi:predicted ATPase
MAQIRQGLDGWRTMGSEAGRSYYLILLAEACMQAGQIGAGLTALEEALAMIDATEERIYEAEVHRLKGELLLRQSVPDAPQAAACFHQALDIARHQQATSWELRAATSLARLWQSQDKRQEATDLLAPVYEWFTEGFDTADLMEAKALLNELAEVSS